MKGEKFKIGFWLFVIGLVGISSLLLTSMPFDQLPLPEEALQKIQEIPEIYLSLLMLINPIVYLIVFVILGTAFL